MSVGIEHERTDLADLGRGQRRGGRRGRLAAVVRRCVAKNVGAAACEKVENIDAPGQQVTAAAVQYDLTGPDGFVEATRTGNGDVLIVYHTMAVIAEIGRVSRTAQ